MDFYRDLGQCEMPPRVKHSFFPFEKQDRQTHLSFSPLSCSPREADAFWFLNPQESSAFWPRRQNCAASTKGLIIVWKRKWLQFCDREGGRNQVSNKNNKLWKKMSQHIFKPGWKGAWRVGFPPPASTPAREDHTRNVLMGGPVRTLAKRNSLPEREAGRRVLFHRTRAVLLSERRYSPGPSTLCVPSKSSLCIKQCHFTCVEGGADLSPAQHHFEATLLKNLFLNT